MYQNRQAFTLIELLVVVLIIGILAAMAMAQYQKSVTRARLAEAKLLVKEISQAVKLYTLSNGQLPSNESDIGIDAIYPFEDLCQQTGSSCPRREVRNWKIERFYYTIASSEGCHNAVQLNSLYDDISLRIYCLETAPIISSCSGTDCAKYLTITSTSETVGTSTVTTTTYDW